MNLPQYNQENEITTSKLRWFGYKSSDIIEYDLESLQKSAHRHNLPHSSTNQVMFMCPLPGNKLFCYSSYLEWQEECCVIFIIDENNDIQIIQRFRFSMWNSLDEKGIAFEEDEKKVLKTFPRGLSNIWSFAAYYKDIVYISMKYLMGFDLVNGRWHTLIKSDKEYCWCTSISFNDKILALEYYSEDICIVDTFILSTSSFSLPIKKLGVKLLFSFKNIVYLVDFGGKILESGVDDPFTWNIISECATLEDNSALGHKAFYKNFWYFSDNESYIYRFGLNQKNIEKINLSLVEGLKENEMDEN